MTMNTPECTHPYGTFPDGNGRWACGRCGAILTENVMNAKEIALHMAERYADNDSSFERDWSEISLYENSDLAIQLCLELGEEMEPLAENPHLVKRALRALLNNDSEEAAKCLRAAFVDYNGAKVFWEKEREEYLLDNSFVGGPDYDQILDAQRG